MHRPPPYAEVLIRPNLMVSMRDGVRLATDLYLHTHTGVNPSLDRERRVARNAVYREKDRPSHLMLPVVGG